MNNNDSVIQSTAARAIIVNDEGKILIVREAGEYLDGDNSGQYDLPGGRVDAGESLIDALKREVAEETGLEVEVDENPISVQEWHPVINGKENHIVGTFFVCRPLSTAVNLSSDHNSYEWIDPDMSSDYDFMPPQLRAINEYKEQL